MDNCGPDFMNEPRYAYERIAHAVFQSLPPKGQLTVHSYVEVYEELEDE
jgi:hypothetical protein